MFGSQQATGQQRQQQGNKGFASTLLGSGNPSNTGQKTLLGA